MEYAARFTLFVALILSSTIAQVSLARNATAPDGTDAFFVIGWAAAADDICRINTYWIVLQLARSKGLTDEELIGGIPEVAKAVARAHRESDVLGPVQWCANYQRGLVKRE